MIVEGLHPVNLSLDPEASTVQGHGPVLSPDPGQAADVPQPGVQPIPRLAEHQNPGPPGSGR